MCAEITSSKPSQKPELPSDTSPEITQLTPAELEKKKREEEAKRLAASSKKGAFQARLVAFIPVAAMAVAVLGLVIAETVYKVVLFIKERWKGVGEKSKAASSEFAQGLIGRIERYTHHVPIAFYEKLPLMQEMESEILDYIGENFDFSSADEQARILGEISKGAHVKLMDNWNAYRKWKRGYINGTRTSSHLSSDQQFAIRGKVVKEMLVGCGNMGEERFTWFQLENAPMAFGNITEHMCDYLRYRITGKQCGPYGTSVHTDKNPIVLRLKTPTTAE